MPKLTEAEISQQIKPLLKKYNISRFFLFGSILTDRFNDKSDIDLMFPGRSTLTIFEMEEFKTELSSTLVER